VYEIRIAPAAERAIGKLSAAVQAAILDRLEELAKDPRPANCEKVRELAQYGVFRARVGKDYRILYQVKDQTAWILVLKVGDRKEIYERLADLKRLLK
jgi:mRNA-degrading endonuclease RelE of RelBE toxin-antitoxin system